jgi:hypothetical protein
MNALESQLDYAFGETLPDTGRTMEVAPGVRWLRMGLPFALNHINLWLLEDEVETPQGRQRGWTVVDCGIATEETRQAWEVLFAEELRACPSCACWSRTAIPTTSAWPTGWPALAGTAVDEHGGLRICARHVSRLARRRGHGGYAAFPASWPGRSRDGRHPAGRNTYYQDLVPRYRVRTTVCRMVTRCASADVTGRSSPASAIRPSMCRCIAAGQCADLGRYGVAAHLHQCLGVCHRA